MNTSEMTGEFSLTKEEILQDYRLACESRQTSILARKEVFMGKAKFGIFGTGKELAQICMAKFFKEGDFRSGYYRDQTFVMATGELSIEQYFAQLYGHADVNHDPHSGGRMMIGHYSTRNLDEQGRFKDLTKIKVSTPDISPTGAQMPRLVGLAWASKLFRNNPELQSMTNFSHNGNEVAFGTIGNGAMAEGVFFEAINAAGVLQIPMLISIWDDAYAISVPQRYQTTKEDISSMFEGFRRDHNERGIEIMKVKGWDYEALCYAYKEATRLCREEHVPVLMHVCEMTQPMGHSTSGSHERYKTKERLDWEEEYDCNKKFREWILENGVCTEDDLLKIEAESVEKVKLARQRAWDNFVKYLKDDHELAVQYIKEAAASSSVKDELEQLSVDLHKTLNPYRSDAVRAVKKALRLLRNETTAAKEHLQDWAARTETENRQRFNSHLYSQSVESALLVPEVAPVISADAPLIDGRELLQHNFEALFKRDARLLAFGEDVGQIGDVNQGFSGLQDKFGEIRITDTGIREATIVGQAIGTAMRGLRPIAEIQYLDYLLFAIEILSDDVASLHYRSAGGQKAPLIIRTRGHRLEGMFHSGSPMQMILGSIRGMFLCVPRNMTQAAGMYNTLIKGDEPAIMIESLNAYRLKEKLPENLGEFTVQLGIVDVLRPGTDITIVTYGSMCRIVQEGANELQQLGISCEIIDIQTLLPFDRTQQIVESIKKTNRVLFADEDYSAGATAYMMQQVLEGQKAWQYLDSEPRTLAAQDNRPAYSTDGDYYSKPSSDDVIDVVYEMMHEVNPAKFPKWYK
ncbi:alpha-ketoacid dehydrogenase subunit alpha/beta [Cytophaga hutchinsonii]|uniref:Transketolase n=1 Tax=Cytophaga hutchinsonii (strain ATCC 33406 / DSM 1761 / CIP 103989 / NBRC 15051 / NCIMB 9469 / D465) TaxID=269798 RepID=A0A6N4SSE4_CYTH3|nr:alpha-ketoacid dehydrogenase subunit alpha/beta [Cytophaga hutchinsonii]ABG59258.1 transketolase [Cytophaga hutchinsonii ATCC 33406]